MPTILESIRRACLALACGTALTQLGIPPASAQTEPSGASAQPDGIDLLWQQHQNDPDLAWRDPTSGCRVVCVAGGFDRLALPYFHQNVFTATGDLMLFTGAHGQDEGYYVLNLKNGGVRQVSDEVGGHMVVMPRRRTAYFDKGDQVFSLNLDTGVIRPVTTVPHGLLDMAAGFGFTADESKLLFAYCDQLSPTFQRVTATPQKDIHKRRLDWIVAYEHMQRHNALYSIDVDSGKLTPLYRDEHNYWLGHVQGSPTDSSKVIFIHEGFVTVHIKNRLRLLDLGTGEITTPRQTAAEQAEGVTHEFWDRDGESVWYDISSAGALGHLDLKTHVETRYAYDGNMSKANRSIHYAIGAGDRWAVGDGGQWGNTWLCLYELDKRDPETNRVPVKHLCDFAPTYNNVHATYIEPNPHLTPDFRWVLFTAHLKGNENKVYAVEIPADAGN